VPILVLNEVTEKIRVTEIKAKETSTFKELSSRIPEIMKCMSVCVDCNNINDLF